MGRRQPSESKRHTFLSLSVAATQSTSTQHSVQRLNNPSRANTLAQGITPDTADRASLNAALTLALTLPGDTLLYLLLPLYAASFGVTLPEAGALLAANRLVRIVGYGWVARFYADRGPGAACLLAAFGAVLSTLMYATLSGVWLLLIGRLMWGISFAAMNIANQAMPTAVIEGAALRAGRARAIIAIGPTVGLLGGAVLALYFGPRSVFLVLTLIACLAPWFASRIPQQREPVALRGPRFELPGPISVWAFSQGFTLDGLFMFGLGLLAATSYQKGAVLAAGFAMSLRYATEVVFSTVGGLLAERFGARRVLVILSLMTAFALALLAGTGPWLWSGVHNCPAGTNSAVGCTPRSRGLSGRGTHSRASPSGDLARHRSGHGTAGRRLSVSDSPSCGNLRWRGSATCCRKPLADAPDCDRQACRRLIPARISRL
jgi:predicted MFS family arabinose efflux permease